MNSTNRDEKALEQLRQLPTELSRQQVQEIITRLPHLPPPASGGFSSFSLNSILMSTIIISALSVLGFFFFNDNSATELAVDSPPILVEETVTAIESTIIKKESQISDYQIIKPETTTVFSTKNSTLTEEVTPLDKLSLAPTPSQIFTPEPPTLLTPSSTAKDDLLASAEQPADLIVKPAAPQLIPSPKKLFPPSPPNIFDTKWGAKKCKLEVYFDKKINVFKNRLLRHLERDGLISSDRQRMLCYFTADAIVVNSQLLSEPLVKKYLTFFADYQLQPCEQRVIETTRDYIAIGDMSDNGFQGQIYGKTDLGNLNTIPPCPLLKHGKKLGAQTEIRPLKDFHTLKTDGIVEVFLTEKDNNQARLEVSGMPIEDILTIEENGVLTITNRGQPNGESVKVYVSSKQLSNIEVGGSSEITPESVINANQLTIKVLDVGSAWVKVAVNELKIIMAGGDLNIDGSANTRELIDLDREQRGTLQEADLKIGTRLHGDAKILSCFELLEIKKYDLQRLQEELRDMIAQERSVKNIDFPVQLHLINQKIEMNGQAVSSISAENYLDLLRQYDIKPCEDRLLVVDKKSIAVGDITEVGFRGTVLGKKLQLKSRYGVVDIDNKSDYHVLSNVSWGTELNIKY